MNGSQRFKFCHNTSNPYHTCSQYCIDRYYQPPQPQYRARQIYKFCPNSTNPWHDCSQYCLNTYKHFIK